MRRFDCLKQLADLLTDQLVVTNLGHTAGEWGAVRPSDGNLYQMGMALATPVSLGLALSLPHRQILALDGDGSLLLNLGVLATVGGLRPGNLVIIVFDNEGYVSAGTQPSATAGRADLAAVARDVGFSRTWTVRSVADFGDAARAALGAGELALIVAKVDSRAEIIDRMPLDGRENMYRFVRHVEAAEQKVILAPTASGRAILPTKVAPIPGGREEGLTDRVLDALRSSGIDFVATLPVSQLNDVQVRCRQELGMLHVGVTNEGEGAAICAGAWLGGLRPALIIASGGLLVAAYALTRCHVTYGIPLLILSTYSGDVGERHWFNVHNGATIEPLLEALRIPRVIVRHLDDIRPAIQQAQDSANASLNPCAVIVGGNLTREKGAV